MSKCGIAYEVNQAPPKPRYARFALYYWGFVIWATSKGAAEKHFSQLTYHQQEDARIVSATKKADVLTSQGESQ